MKKHLIVVALILAIFASLHFAHAQTPSNAPIYPASPTIALTKVAPNTFTLSWTAPTTNVDGSALASAQLPLTYVIWQGTGAAGSPLAQVATGVTGLTWTSATFAATADFSTQKPCFAVSARDALGEQSAPTNVICTAVTTPKPTPHPPGGVTVQ